MRDRAQSDKRRPMGTKISAGLGSANRSVPQISMHAHQTFGSKFMTDHGGTFDLASFSSADRWQPFPALIGLKKSFIRNFRRGAAVSAKLKG